MSPGYISISDTVEIGVADLEDSLTARFARGSFILSITTVRDVSLALWCAIRHTAALACGSTTTEGRALARPGHIDALVAVIASD